MNKDLKYALKAFDSSKTVLVLGETGTGKSTLIEQIYRGLKEQSTKEQLKFYIFDFTRVEFLEWKNDAFLIGPVVYDIEKAVTLLKELSKKQFGTKTIIHIEECDLAYYDIKVLENIWLHSLSEKNLKVVFTTSRPAEEVITDFVLGNAECKLLFKVSTKDQSKRLYGQEGIETLKKGQYIISHSSISSDS